MDEQTGWARWLDAEMLQFVATCARLDADAGEPADPAASRARYDRLCAAFRAPRPEGVSVDDMAVATAWGAVPVRRYRPPHRGPAATLLYVHGGGFVLGGLDSHDDVCAELCAGAAIDVVALQYRLAPEHPYPAALDDVAAVHAAVADHGEVLVAGDSAGGNLAAALCRRLRRQGAPQPLGQVLIYPMLGAAPQVAPGSRAANAPLLNAADCIAFAQFYAGTASPSPAADPEYAPLAAAVFGHLAPAAIFASGFDPLRQDAADYAAALHAAGVPVAYREDPGLVHGWLRARHRASLADRAFTALLQAVSDLAAGRLRPA